MLGQRRRQEAKKEDASESQWEMSGRKLRRIEWVKVKY